MSIRLDRVHAAQVIGETILQNVYRPNSEILRVVLFGITHAVQSENVIHSQFNVTKLSATHFPKAFDQPSGASSVDRPCGLWSRCSMEAKLAVTLTHMLTEPSDLSHSQHIYSYKSLRPK